MGTYVAILAKVYRAKNCLPQALVYSKTELFLGTELLLTALALYSQGSYSID